jgi:hypothetical protein
MGCGGRYCRGAMLEKCIVKFECGSGVRHHILFNSTHIREKTVLKNTQRISKAFKSQGDEPLTTFFLILLIMRSRREFL